ncbi:MAG: hypothetical protein AB7N54_10770 [Alphaproteobacteria bacterium]
MIGIISLAVLVAAFVVARVVARKLGGGAATGFVARRGVAETISLVIVAAISFPIAGVLDFLLSDGIGSLDAIGWGAVVAILAAGVWGWRLAGRIRKRTGVVRQPVKAAANDLTASERREVA